MVQNYFGGEYLMMKYGLMYTAAIALSVMFYAPEFEFSYLDFRLMVAVILIVFFTTKIYGEDIGGWSIYKDEERWKLIFYRSFSAFLICNAAGYSLSWVVSLAIR